MLLPSFTSTQPWIAQKPSFHFVAFSCAFFDTFKLFPDTLFLFASASDLAFNVTT